MALFTGFSTFNADQNNNILEDIELVKRDLLNHFHTRLGERVMYPNFGTIIWDMIFEPMTEANIELIRSDAERVILSEPRVVLQDLQLLELQYGVEIRASLLYNGFNVVDTFEATFDTRAQERVLG